MHPARRVVCAQFVYEYDSLFVCESDVPFIFDSDMPFICVKWRKQSGVIEC